MDIILVFETEGVGSIPTTRTDSEWAAGVDFPLNRRAQRSNLTPPSATRRRSLNRRRKMNESEPNAGTPEKASSLHEVDGRLAELKRRWIAALAAQCARSGSNDKEYNRLCAEQQRRWREYRAAQESLFHPCYPVDAGLSAFHQTLCNRAQKGY